MIIRNTALVLALAGGLSACSQDPAQRAANTRDVECAGGTFTGTLIGAALGNQVGGGSGRTVATVAGGAAGAYAGQKVAC